MATARSRPALLFDLDGTLADTALDIASALDATLADLSLPLAGIAQTRQWIGGGAPALVSRALDTLAPDYDDRQVEQALNVFMHHYEHYNGTHCKLYPGVADTFSELRANDISMACVTNKPYRFAVAVLDKFALSDHFTCVIGGDSLALKKPDPLPLHTALGSLQATAENSWMIGDSATDVNAARNAGVRSAWVSYGYHQGLGPAELEPDRVLQEFSEVLGLT
ncbi:MAG: phosphoglycolate phosphatase [Lysobacterales bacterium]